MKMRNLWAALGCGLLGLAGGLAQADTNNYPERDIKIVVPFSSGGGIDIMGRTVGNNLSKLWDVPVVVENKPGGSGNIGTVYAARSKPDGYTQLMTVNTLVMTPSLMDGVGFDPVKDFEPVSKTAIGYLAFVTRADLDEGNMPDLIKKAKAEPGKLNYGSPGPGTPHHLAMELLKQEAGFDAIHVPYKGSAELVRGLLGGQVDFAFLPIHQALELAKADKLKMLAAGGTARSQATPDVPSLAEATGIKDIDVDMWYGLYLPKGTPAPIVEKLNAAVAEILKQPDVVKSLNDLGLAPSSSSPKELADLTAADLERWGRVIQEAGIKPD